MASPLHYAIAKRLILAFPKLINDIYIDDEYFGENVLHMAIVNEDPSMVRFLLGHAVNVQERAFGNFFTPLDQKDSRVDTLEGERVLVQAETNYIGYAYMGEFPHCFAACLQQEECYRM